HGARADAGRAADDARRVRLARVALERRGRLMAIHAARMLQHADDLAPSREAIVGGKGGRRRGDEDEANGCDEPVILAHIERSPWAKRSMDGAISLEA